MEIKKIIGLVIGIGAILAILSILTVIIIVIVASKKNSNSNNTATTTTSTSTTTKTTISFIPKSQTTIIGTITTSLTPSQCISFFNDSTLTQTAGTDNTVTISASTVDDTEYWFLRFQNYFKANNITYTSENKNTITLYTITVIVNIDNNKSYEVEIINNHNKSEYQTLLSSINKILDNYTTYKIIETSTSTNEYAQEFKYKISDSKQYTNLCKELNDFVEKNYSLDTEITIKDNHKI